MTDALKDLDEFEEATDIKQAIDEAAKDPEPCVGCANRQRCVQLRLACDSFVGWVDNGRANDRPRIPNAGSYLFLYPEDIQGKPDA